MMCSSSFLLHMDNNKLILGARPPLPESGLKKRHFQRSFAAITMISGGRVADSMYKGAHTG